MLQAVREGKGTMGKVWNTSRGDSTRRYILDFAVALLRAEGLQGLTTRRVAAGSGLSIGAVQFHFGPHESLAKDTVRIWIQMVSNALEDATRGTLGLERLWLGAQHWIAVPETPVICSVNQNTAAIALLASGMKRWIGETRRGFRQAQLRGEVSDELHPFTAAIELHGLLWSHGWTAATFGAELCDEQRRRIARRYLERLARVPFGGCFSPSDRSALELEDPFETTATADVAPDEPIWRWTLEPTDPQYHAYERHELLGDPRPVGCPPEVLPRDVAAAESVRLKLSLRAAPGDGGS